MEPLAREPHASAWGYHEIAQRLNRTANVNERAKSLNWGGMARATGPDESKIISTFRSAFRTDSSAWTTASPRSIPSTPTDVIPIPASPMRQARGYFGIKI